jgi:hypothetical protein
MSIQLKRAPVAAGTLTLGAILCVAVWGSMSEGGRETELVSVVLVLAPFALALVATWLVPGTPKDPASGPQRWLPVTWWVSKGERWVWGLICVAALLMCAALVAHSWAVSERAFELESSLKNCEQSRTKCEESNSFLRQLSDFYYRHRDSLKYMREYAANRGVSLPTDEELEKMHSR